jgi:hypothetical protein
MPASQGPELPFGEAHSRQKAAFDRRGYRKAFRLQRAPAFGHTRKNIPKEEN